MKYKIKELKQDVLDGKIQMFSTMNFYKVVFLEYKNGLCIEKQFENGHDFVDFVKFLNENKVKFEPLKH